MVVFAKATKIARSVTDPLNDHKLPPSKALAWGGIKGPAALAGTTGADAKLVHGDRWQQIIGSETVSISQNYTMTIMQNEAYTVLANRTTTVAGNYTKLIVGVYNHTTVNAHVQLNVSVTNTTFLSPKVVVYASPHNSSQPTSLLEYIQTNSKSFWYKGEAALIKIDLGGEKLEGWLHKTDLKAMATKLIGIKNKVNPLEVKVNTLEQQINTLQSKLSVVQPSVAISYVHMVTITVKALIVGVNQFI
jgi:hypothetical protein